MDQFPPGTLVFIYDLNRKPGTRIELGTGMHKFLAENPDAWPTIAVELLVAGINEVAVDPDEADRIQWQAVRAMTQKLERFERAKRTFDGPPHDAPTRDEP